MVVFKMSILNRFPFPSNGKTYSNDYDLQGIDPTITVSIPFKRENIYQQTIADAVRVCRDRFPFPSNGKTYSNLPAMQTVGHSSGHGINCFHSLQTGKHIATHE